MWQSVHPVVLSVLSPPQLSQFISLLNLARNLEQSDNSLEKPVEKTVEGPSNPYNHFPPKPVETADPDATAILDEPAIDPDIDAPIIPKNLDARIGTEDVDERDPTNADEPLSKFRISIKIKNKCPAIPDEAVDEPTPTENHPPTPIHTEVELEGKTSSLAGHTDRPR